MALANPLAENLSVMRTSLWPGLVTSCQFNLNRQQERVRLFEIGAVFHKAANGEVRESAMLGGVVTGSVCPLQWSTDSEKMVDFYSVKSDLNSIFALTGDESRFIFNRLEHKALHPGQSSGIYLQEELVGYLGKIHPRVARENDLPDDVFLFELDLDKVLQGSVPSFQPVSKFPAVTRDLALITQQHVAVNEMLININKLGIDELNSVKLFDVYSGLGVAEECKSVAIKLTFQHQLRTLTDDEIDRFVSCVLEMLKQDFNAELRN